MRRLSSASTSLRRRMCTSRMCSRGVCTSTDVSHSTTDHLAANYVTAMLSSSSSDGRTCFRTATANHSQSHLYVFRSMHRAIYGSNSVQLHLRTSSNTTNACYRSSSWVHRPKSWIYRSSSWMSAKPGPLPAFLSPKKTDFPFWLSLTDSSAQQKLPLTCHASRGLFSWILIWLLGLVFVEHQSTQSVCKKLGKDQNFC